MFNKREIIAMLQWVEIVKENEGWLTEEDEAIKEKLNNMLKEAE